MTESDVLEGDAVYAVPPPHMPSATAFAPLIPAPPRARFTAVAGSTLAIDAAAEPGATVAALAGELDRWTAPTLAELLDELTAQRVAHLVLDLKQLYYVDASGLLLILDAYRDLRESGARLSLAGVRPRVADIMRRTGADQVLPVYRTVEQAVEPDEAVHPYPDN